MQEKENHPFDLEKRTTEFAKKIILLCKKIPRSSMSDRLIGQVVGSAGSVGANYREANDSLGEKDFALKLKISRRESKETLHWLELIETANPELKSDIEPLKQECVELKNILSSILKKFNV